MIFFLLASLALGPETPVTKIPRLLNSTIAPQTPHVITDGSGFLAGWQRGETFARVNSEGEVVDRPSIRITPPPNVRWFDLIRHRDADVVGWYYFLDSGIVHVRVGTLTSTLFDVALPNADINSDTFKL